MPGQVHQKKWCRAGNHPMEKTNMALTIAVRSEDGSIEHITACKDCHNRHYLKNE